MVTAPECAGKGSNSMKKTALFLCIILILSIFSASAESLPSFAALTGMDQICELLSTGITLESAAYTKGTKLSDQLAETSDPDTVQALWQALSGIELGEPVNEFITDWYPKIIFTLSDGTTFSLCFDAHRLETADHKVYLLRNDEAFWELTQELLLQHVPVQPVPLAGGWTYAEDPAVTEEVRDLLRRAVTGLVGTTYEPVAYLGSQVVAGRNHALLVQTRAVYPGATAAYTILYLYEALDGTVSILDLVPLDLGSLRTPGEA